MIGKQLRVSGRAWVGAVSLCALLPCQASAQADALRLTGSAYSLTVLPRYDYTAGHAPATVSDDSLDLTAEEVIYGRRLARSSGKLARLAERGIVIPLRRIAMAHKLHCETLNLYTSVSLGDAVKLPDGKRAVIVDYVIKPRYLEFIDFVGAEPGAKGRIRLKKTPAIRNLKVIVSESERSLTLSDGVVNFGSVELETKFETVELDPEVTKAVIIGRMIQADQIDNVLRAYPEERANLAMWVAKYPKPLWKKPARKAPPATPAKGTPKPRRPARRDARG